MLAYARVTLEGLVNAPVSNTGLAILPSCTLVSPSEIRPSANASVAYPAFQGAPVLNAGLAIAPATHTELYGTRDLQTLPSGAQVSQTHLSRAQVSQTLLHEHRSRKCSSLEHRLRKCSCHEHRSHNRSGHFRWRNALVLANDPFMNTGHRCCCTILVYQVTGDVLGSLDQWFFGSVVSWFFGSVVRWFVGFVVPWFLGSLNHMRWTLRRPRYKHRTR